MASVRELESRITAIERRNASVALDKAWETSGTRRALLIVFTYVSIGLYMQAIGVTEPWINAVVPSVGFFLSTLTLPWFKAMWKRHRSP